MIKTKLNELLASKGMTQEELAANTGLRLNVVSGMCANTSVAYAKRALNLICRELKCQPQDIIEYVEED